MNEKWQRRLAIMSKVTLMGGAVWLVGHPHVAHAANSGVPEFDLPGQTTGAIIQGPLAYYGGNAGWLGLAADAVRGGGHIGALGIGCGTVAAAGTAVHHYPTLANHFGMANAALIHAHKVATLAPPVMHVLRHLIG